MKTECEDCRGGLLKPNLPCPTCGGKGYVGLSRRPKGSSSSGGFQTEVGQKLASPEWEDMVRRSRKLAGLPPQGLDPEAAPDLLARMVNYAIFLCLLTDPREEIRKGLATNAPGGQDSEEYVEQCVRRLEEITPLFQVFKLRFEAAHLASWLGVEDEESIMHYLISPQRWPLNNWRPSKAKKRGQAVGSTLIRLVSTLLPGLDERRLKVGVLRGFVMAKDGRTTWEDLRLALNKYFPLWGVDHWRDLRKQYVYHVDHTKRDRDSEGGRYLTKIWDAIEEEQLQTSRGENDETPPG